MNTFVPAFHAATCLVLLVWMQSTAWGQAVIPPQAIEGWRQMQSMVDPIQLTVEFIQREENTLTHYVCAIQGDLMKCEERKIEGRSRVDEVSIFNRRVFYLSSEKAGKWGLRGMGQAGERPVGLDNLFHHVKEGFALHGSALLVDTVDSSKYDLLGWDETADRAVFTVKDHSGVHCIMTLNPRKRYRVEAARYTDDDDPEFSDYVYEYSDDSLLTEIVPTRFYPKGLEREWRLLSIANERLPETEFRLSHYGLPDFQEPEPKLGLRMWFLLLAMTLAALVFWRTRKAAAV